MKISSASHLAALRKAYDATYSDALNARADLSKATKRPHSFAIGCFKDGILYGGVLGDYRKAIPFLELSDAAFRSCRSLDAYDGVSRLPGAGLLASVQAEVAVWTIRALGIGDSVFAEARGIAHAANATATLMEGALAEHGPDPRFSSVLVFDWLALAILSTQHQIGEVDLSPLTQAADAVVPKPWMDLHRDLLAALSQGDFDPLRESYCRLFRAEEHAESLISGMTAYSIYLLSLAVNRGDAGSSLDHFLCTR